MLEPSYLETIMPAKGPDDNLILLIINLAKQIYIDVDALPNERMSTEPSNP